MSEVAVVKTVRLCAFRDYSSGRWQGSAAVLRDGSVVRVPRRGENCHSQPHVVECKVVREYAHGDLEEKIVNFTVDTDVLALLSGFGRVGDWCTMDVVSGEGDVYLRYFLPQSRYILYVYHNFEAGEMIKTKVLDCRAEIGP